MVAATAPLASRPRTVNRVAGGPRLVRAGGNRWLGWGMIGGAAALVPWMWMLAATMPSSAVVANWSTAWVGLDAMEAAALLGTGVLYVRGDRRYGLGAAVTGTLLIVDAWFDVTTATPGPGRTAAIALAAGVELPLAALCAVLAGRAFTQGAVVIHDAVNSGWQSIDRSTPDG